MVKKCGKCKIEKIYSEFYKRKEAKDGLTSLCKCCVKERVKQYNQENKERKKQYYQENKEYIKQYQQENKEHYKEYRKQYYRENKENYKEYNKQYNQENKERIIEYKKQYRQENKEYYKEYSKQHYQDNRELYNERNKQYIKKKRKTDPLFKMKVNLRNRTYKAFKCNGYSKNTKTQQMLGVSWEVCKAHIERQFTKGMNWDNQGQWHIDHITPLASANNEEELMKLCHYTNLQPLWAEDNLSKSDKIIEQQIKLTI